MSSKHTKEPWVRRYCDRVTIPDDLDGSKSIVHCYNTSGHNCEANASRIVACVNACAGIPTADLPALSASRERERVLRQDLSDCIDVLQMCIDDDTRMKESTRGGIVGCINVLQAALAKTGGG